MVVLASRAFLLRCDHVTALQELQGLGAPSALVGTLQRVRSLLPGTWEQRPVYVCVSFCSEVVSVPCPAAAGLVWFLAWALGADVTARGAAAVRLSPVGLVVRGSARSCRLMRGPVPVLRTCCASPTVRVTSPWPGTGAPVSPCLCQHLFPFFFWIIAMLTGVKWYLIAALFSVVDHKNNICSLSLEYS